VRQSSTNYGLKGAAAYFGWYRLFASVEVAAYTSKVIKRFVAIPVNYGL
jgi:hypothetical protein